MCLVSTKAAFFCGSSSTFQRSGQQHVSWGTGQRGESITALILNSHFKTQYEKVITHFWHIAQKICKMYKKINNVSNDMAQNVEICKCF